MVTAMVQIGLAAGVLVCVFKVGVGEGMRRERLRQLRRTTIRVEKFDAGSVPAARFVTTDRWSA